MPEPKQTDLGEILAAMRDQLLAEGVVAARGQVIVSAQRTPLTEHLESQKDVVIRPMRRRLIQPTFTGGGRLAAQISRDIAFYARYALAIDKQLTDVQFISQIDRFEAAILSAFLDWLPADRAGNALLCEPMILLDGSEMVKSEDDVWGDAVAAYRIVYRPSIDLTVI